MSKQMVLFVVVTVFVFASVGCSYLDSLIIPEDPDVPEFSIAVQTVGEGHVVIEPEVYALGDQVTLTAMGAEDWVFLEWAEDVSGNHPQIHLTAEEGMVVTAQFLRVMENILSNPGFEDETLDPWGITESGSGTTLEKVNYTKVEGEYAAKISGRTNTWNRIRVVRGSGAFDLGEMYFVSYWAKHGEGTADSRFRIETFSAVEGEINDQEWTRISGVFQMPDELVNWPSVEIRVASTEDYYVDDIILARIHPDSL